MRFGVKVGPFYAGTSHHRRRGEFSPVGAFLLILIPVAVAFAYPWQTGGVVLVIVGLIIWRVRWLRASARRSAIARASFDARLKADIDAESAKFRAGEITFGELSKAHDAIVSRYRVELGKAP